MFENTNLYARYGVLYGSIMRAEVNWQFEEILAPGMDTYKNVVTIPDVSNYFHFYIIQTYEYAPHKAYYKYEKNKEGTIDEVYNTDYMSIIAEFTKEKLKGNTEIKVFMSINSDNELNLVVTNTENEPILKQKDLTALRTNIAHSDTFRKSMWPYFEDYKAKK